jgi:alkanesulfonate monooxygenase SsuD/methylene tetrahydromethanopterin reductase-like flavin-dependent oxidoreductase (luciferase family)
VFRLQHAAFLRQAWDRYAERYTETHGQELAPGEKRMLVVNTCVADSHEAAVDQVRNGHDEFWKFLGPYGWSRGYRQADGTPAPPGLIPSLDQSLENQTWLVGTADEVAEQIDHYRRHLGGIQELVLFPAMPGDRYDAVEEQLHRLAEDVMPRLS